MIIIAIAVVVVLALVAIWVKHWPTDRIPEDGSRPISSLWAPSLIGLLRNVGHIQEYLHKLYSELPSEKRQPLFRLSLGGYNAVVAVDPLATREILAQVRSYYNEQSVKNFRL